MLPSAACRRSPGAPWPTGTYPVIARAAVARASAPGRQTASSEVDASKPALSGEAPGMASLPSSLAPHLWRFAIIPMPSNLLSNILSTLLALAAGVPDPTTWGGVNPRPPPPPRQSRPAGACYPKARPASVTGQAHEWPRFNSLLVDQSAPVVACSPRQSGAARFRATCALQGAPRNSDKGRATRARGLSRAGCGPPAAAAT